MTPTAAKPAAKPTAKPAAKPGAPPAAKALGVMNETGLSLRPDVSRVVLRFFVPGREFVGAGASRAAPVIERILALREPEVEVELDDLIARFADRHRNFADVIDAHAEMVMSRIDPGVELSAARRRYIGAVFTNEYSIEGAALCNPSAVVHPVQDRDGVAFVMSVRGIGEGHRSTIGFRTGVVCSDGTVSLDPPGPFPETVDAGPGTHHRSVFHAKLAAMGDDVENTAYVLDQLDPLFTDDALGLRIASLAADMATRQTAETTLANLRRLAGSSYSVEFAASSQFSERVLWPHAPHEQQGVEDARFVRFVDDDGSVRYLGTYTAFDGREISQQLLETSDFRSFSSSPIAGDAAAGKGLAIFPRKIDGRFVALSRSDRETNAVAFSDDLYLWERGEQIQVPTDAWEIMQLGNCGSPLETPDGWLVLTHGVGAMRTYALGAILLDLDDPTVVLARSSGPILSASNAHRDGYVPNVVYSCGGFITNGTLVLPYGLADQNISIATVNVADLVSSLVPVPR